MTVDTVVPSFLAFLLRVSRSWKVTRNDRTRSRVSGVVVVTTVTPVVSATGHVTTFGGHGVAVIAAVHTAVATLAPRHTATGALAEVGTATATIGET